MSVAQTSSSQSEKSETAAVLLSLIMTGLGQIYSGALERGLILLVIYLFLCGLSIGTGVFIVVLIPYWIWGMFDASAHAKKFNDKTNSVLREAANKQAEAAIVASGSTGTSEFVNQLEKLSKLHKSGILENDEYSSRKNLIIENLREKKPRDSAEDFLSGIIPLVEENKITAEELALIKRLVL